jgi:oleandomycin transport system permease protein
MSKSTLTPVLLETVAPPPGETGRLREAVASSLVIARRNLLKVTGDPGQLLDATLMPMVFTIVFVYVFGGAIAGSQANYVQYFVPGIMALTITIIARTTGIGLSVDFSNGIVQRFRSLPIAQSAMLSGRVVADSARMLLSQVVMLGFASLVGFRITTSPLAVAAAVALMVGFGVALSWVSTFIGIAVRSVQTAETVLTLWLVPLQFGSSLFVQPSTMPGWLQVFVRLNPMTLVIDAVRHLLRGGPAGHSALGGLVWIIGTIAVFAPLSVRQYRRRR